MSESQPQDGQSWQHDDLDPEEHGESVVGGEGVAHAARQGTPKRHRLQQRKTPVSAVEQLRSRGTDLRE
jgi:hypothetical protein